MEKTTNTSPIVSFRISPDERRLIEEAAAKKGWKTAHFLRISAIERAANVLNLSRPSTFDFSAAAKRYAEVLLAPRTVSLVERGCASGPFGESWRFGEGPIDFPGITSEPGCEFKCEDMDLTDFRPAPLTPDAIDQLQEAMRLGGVEFGAELLAECRRLVNNPQDPALPPPIDPQNLNDLNLDKETA